MINYTITANKVQVNKLDKSKNNILIIGTASTSSKSKIILNPMTIETAKLLYGDNSPLTNAYLQAREITNDVNIYTVNCPLITDFLEIIDTIVQYEFDYIVPINVYLRDKFMNPLTNRLTYYMEYLLEKLKRSSNRGTVIITDYSSVLYDDIDNYLKDMENVFNAFKKSCSHTLNLCGNNLVFVLNNFLNDIKSNVTLAAGLSVCNFHTYISNINYKTYFDLDYTDVKNKSFCFYKYHVPNSTCSIEQLNNCRHINDIYKKVLIDALIKYILKRLDFTEFNGTLYNPYVQIKIETKVFQIMNSIKSSFVSYSVNYIGFKQTGIGVGTVIIDLSVVPHSLLESINIVLEL